MRSLLLLTLLIIAATSAHAEADPLRVGSISVETDNVFGPEDGDYRLNRLANRLHAVTAAATIRRELLFATGDPYDPDIVAETERNLRGTGYLGEVTIDADTLATGEVNLTVRTRDKWTLSLHSSFGQEGGVRAYELGFRERNLLGRGKEVQLRGNYRSDRRDEFGQALRFKDPRLLGSHWLADLQWRDFEELRLRSVLLARPYFAERSRWAGGVYFDSGERLLKEYDAGELVAERELSGDDLRAWVSRSYGERVKHRLTLSYRHSRIDHGAVPLRAMDRLDLLQASLLLHSHRFVERRGLDGLGHTEDLPLGAQLGLAYGYDMAAGGAEHMVVLHAQLTRFLLPGWYAGARVDYESYYEGGEERDAWLQMRLVQHFDAPGRQLFVLRAAGAFGRSVYPGWQLQLGSPTGLRGYDTYGLQGRRRLVLGLEDRLSPAFRAWIFRVGAAAFVDIGAVWDEGERLADQRWHGSAGIGLRLASTKAHGNTLTRVDFAWNFDEGKLSAVIIAGGQLFNAYLGRASLWPFQ